MTPIVKAVLRTKNKVRVLIFSDFKLYHKAIVIKITWYWQQNKQINGAKCRTNKYMYANMVKKKILITKTIQWGKDHFFNKWYWEKRDLT